MKAITLAAITACIWTYGMDLRGKRTAAVSAAAAAASRRRRAPAGRRRSTEDRREGYTGNVQRLLKTYKARAK